MKKLIVLFSLIMSIFMFKAEAQKRVNVDINIGVQPMWGPVGYDYVGYYYLPDMDVYYYVPQRQFIYMESGRWMFATSLPPRYRGYDLYNSYKVVINEPKPYLRAHYYQERYAPYRGKRDQVTLRDKGDNGNHYGWNKGKKGKGKNK